jgi:glycosyltransferase involved in cell wall biosynthesis|tara:strand:+ start:179 stop:1147 length:969 start_codon:yes stop_codon:yes gene_type:complete
LISLLILAYNEELRIIDVIKKYEKLFSEIIVINDCSKDSTKELISNYIESRNSKNKIVLIDNKKNVGAGKSFQMGVDYFLKTKNQFLVKIDGDGQFFEPDIRTIINLIERDSVDYIKGDRFWEDGVTGDIPTIRYVGNTLASLMIKLSTGNWKMNDPLNGLVAFSAAALKNLNIPKLFFRYGYPFYLCVNTSKLSYTENLQTIQIKNTVIYDDEQSNLKPSIMFFKLTFYTIFSYFSKIKLKFKNSKLQMSALLDILFTVLFGLFIYSFSTFLRVRYFLFSGDEANWFVVTIIFLVISFVVFISSQKSENLLHSEKFKDYVQ